VETGFAVTYIDLFWSHRKGFYLEIVNLPEEVNMESVTISKGERQDI
jgi:hypothetical protein